MCLFFHFCEIGSPPCYLPPSIYVCFRDCLVAGLGYPVCKSQLLSDFMKGLMVPFLLVLRVAFPNPLFLGYMSVFLVLPIAGRVLMSSSMML